MSSSNLRGVCVGVRKTVGHVDGVDRLGKGGSWHHQGKSRRRDDPPPPPLPVVLGLCFEVTASISFWSETANLARIRQAQRMKLQRIFTPCRARYSAVIFSVSSRFTAVAASAHSLTPTFNPSITIPSPLPGLPFSSRWSGLYTLTPAATRITASDPPTRNLGMMGKSSILQKRRSSSCAKTSATHPPAMPLPFVQAWTATQSPVPRSPTASFPQPTPPFRETREGVSVRERSVVFYSTPRPLDFLLLLVVVGEGGGPVLCLLLAARNTALGAPPSWPGGGGGSDHLLVRTELDSIWSLEPNVRIS